MDVPVIYISTIYPIGGCCETSKTVHHRFVLEYHSIEVGSLDGIAPSRPGYESGPLADYGIETRGINKGCDIGKLLMKL